jgi:hypothetical protein
MKTIKNCIRYAKFLARSTQMKLKLESLFLISNKSSPKLFNLDLHVSVIEDLKIEFSDLNIEVVNWSISGSNRFKRKFFTNPDPVKYINNNTWQNLSPELINDFISCYGRCLKKFDGFVVTHTPSFAQIYENFQKPILIVASTRYEAPYSNDQVLWKNLDDFLIRGVSGGYIDLVANNCGDKDYLKYFTGLNAKLVPSVCDYTNYGWKRNEGIKLIMGHSNELISEIVRMNPGKWVGYREYLGTNYNWEDFDSISEILVIPYNISTMTLFEFATAGIPVAIPTPRFLKELTISFDGVLSELSYYQVLKLKSDLLESNNPNNFDSDYFFEWWINRSDFYNSKLMPNVRLIDSFEEFSKTESVYSRNQFGYFKSISERNIEYKSKRKKMINDFVSKL